MPRIVLSNLRNIEMRDMQRKSMMPSERVCDSEYANDLIYQKSLYENKLKLKIKSKELLDDQSIEK